MFATLLSAGGVYLYLQYVTSLLEVEIAALNSEIGSFSQADMERVTEFDLRLEQAHARLESSASVASIFEALQDATVETVQIESLNIEREGDETFVLSAAIQTDSFDSTIFQRGVFLREGTIQNIEITDVQNSVSGGEGDSPESAGEPSIVTFNALLEVPLSEVPATIQSVEVFQSPLETVPSIESELEIDPAAELEASAAATISEEAVNQDAI